MTKSIHTILTPFLIISYVFGSRIATFNHSRLLWFSAIYILLVWSVYYFLVSSAPISLYVYFEDNICYYLEFFTTLLSIAYGIYHDKKFQNCLKRFDIIDNTLLKLGTVTDYDKLRRKVMCYVLGWIVTVILIIYFTAIIFKNENDDIASAMYYSCLRDYSFHINFIGDLFNASILEYTGLKFDQINEHIRKLMKTQKHVITRAWENNSIHPHQSRSSKPLSNKCITWITIHLYLELRKISREIDLIFGTQMSIKMACYFGWIAVDLREIFYAMTINNYVTSKIIAITVHTFCLFDNIFKFLLINYMCEMVTTKASATADLLNRLSYVTCDIEIRETISQFSLGIIHMPLRFYGIGLFQFGFKFLHGFIPSVATVLVIILQAQTNKQKFI